MALMKKNMGDKEGNMSGGYFEYRQSYIDEIARSLEDLIRENDKLEFPYSEDTIARFKDAMQQLYSVSKKIHCIDWLLSNDTSEDDAWEGWPEEWLAQNEKE